MPHAVGVCDPAPPASLWRRRLQAVLQVSPAHLPSDSSSFSSLLDFPLAFVGAQVLLGRVSKQSAFSLLKSTIRVWEASSCAMPKNSKSESCILARKIIGFMENLDYGGLPCDATWPQRPRMPPSRNPSFQQGQFSFFKVLQVVPCLT